MALQLGGPTCSPRSRRFRSSPCSLPFACTTTSTRAGRSAAETSRGLWKQAAGKDTPFPHASERSSVAQRSDCFPRQAGALPSPVSAPAGALRTGLARFSWSRDGTRVKFLAGNHAEQEAEHQTCSRCDLPSVFTKLSSSGDRESCLPVRLLIPLHHQKLSSSLLILSGSLPRTSPA